MRSGIGSGPLRFVPLEWLSTTGRPAPLTKAPPDRSELESVEQHSFPRRLLTLKCHANRGPSSSETSPTYGILSPSDI